MASVNSRAAPVKRESTSTPRKSSLEATNSLATRFMPSCSELFGHERGSFTGAENRRIGKFEQSHGGTLFLDEIGDMTPGTQAKILRLLQEGRFERVGGNESISADVRVIAATNQNLDKLIEDGKFRKDLYYRLRGVTIQLPPLNQRSEDIAELAYYFLFRFNRQLGTTVQSIAPEAMVLLEQFSWPGNVRQLQNVIREALIVSAGPILLPEFLSPEIREPIVQEEDLPEEAALLPAPDWQTLSDFVEKAVGTGRTDVYRNAREQFDRLLVLRAMQQTGGNQHQAAEILGISRVTLRSKLRAIRV
jgi:DNA-binding NtrC family response regulator